MALLHCEINSKAIRMVTSVCVILPHDTSAPDGAGRLSAARIEEKPVKTLYLLHGRSHNYSVWTRYTNLERYAEKHNIAVIMPEVNRSFYTDMRYGVNYQTYVSEELPDLCESMFRISNKPEDRFIAGMSMGGYGALKTALTHPDRYAACGMLSAVTDIRQHIADTPETNPKRQEFQGIFGTGLNVSPDDDMYQLAQACALLPKKPDFYLACGTEDHLYQETIRFYSFLQTLPYRLTYEEWEGIHDWVFWDEGIKRMMNHFFADDESSKKEKL